MNWADAIGGLVTGGVGGLASGFLGVTAGGILVPLLILILGKDQHVAQGISLVAQIVPTSQPACAITAAAAIASQCAGSSGSRPASG